MNYVCLVGQVVAWESHALECEPPADAKQCGFNLRIKDSADVFCTLMYMSDDTEAALLQYTKYAVVVGSVVDANPLSIQLCAYQCFNEEPSEYAVLRSYSRAMRELYIRSGFDY